MFAPNIPTPSTSRKLLTSAALVALTAGAASLTTFASFTGSAAANHDVTAGTVEVGLGTDGTAANRLSVDATAVAAGDTIQRAVTLTNTGTLDWADAKLTTTANVTSVLDTDSLDGLQLTVDACDAPWTEAGTAPAYTYTCSGTTTNVLSSQPVIGANRSLGSVNSLTAGGNDYLRVQLELPASAGNAFQGQTSSIDFTFDAVQRTATNR